jgi:glucose-6-phosphate 1-dehydrogenase
LQPEEGINLTFQTKKPGTKVCLHPVAMDFSYQKGVLLDAYDWVLHDCILGDQMLFLHQEGVEQTWSLLTPAIDTIESDAHIRHFPIYPAGSPGPDEADTFIEKDGRSWRPLHFETSDESADISRFRGIKQ